MVLEMRCGGYICVLMSTKVLFLLFSKFFLYTWEDKYCVKNFPLKKEREKRYVMISMVFWLELAL